MFKGRVAVKVINCMCRKGHRVFLFVLFALLPVLAPAGEAAKPLPVVGVLEVGAEDGDQIFPRTLRDELAKRGLRENEHYRFLVRYAAHRDDKLESAVRALAAAKPTVLVGWGIKPVKMMMELAPETPVVTTGSGNMLQLGLVKSFTAPGGMVTGITNGELQHGMKPLDLLHQAFPKVRRVGIVFNQTNPAHVKWTDEIRKGLPQAQGLELIPAYANTPETFEKAAAEFARRGVRIVYIAPDWIDLTPAWSASARRHRLALVGWKIPLADNGGLFSVGLVPGAGARLATRHIEKVLQGAKPADLPIERNNSNVLVVNLKTAARLGVKLPPDLIARADRIIQ